MQNKMKLDAEIFDADLNENRCKFARQPKYRYSGWWLKKCKNSCMNSHFCMESRTVCSFRPPSPISIDVHHRSRNPESKEGW